MSSPSAPAATAARATGSTRYHFPVPCDGSATTGRCESFLRSGIALMSKVFRVYFSNVRIPRSQRITFGFPFARMYSADRSSSSTVADIPRFSNTGLDCSPQASSSDKFCMLLARFHRARSRHDHERLAGPDGDVSDPHDRVGRMHLARAQLERTAHEDDLGDAGERLELIGVLARGDAERSDRGPLGAGERDR